MEWSEFGPARCEEELIETLYICTEHNAFYTPTE